MPQFLAIVWRHIDRQQQQRLEVSVRLWSLSPEALMADCRTKLVQDLETFIPDDTTSIDAMEMPHEQGTLPGAVGGLMELAEMHVDTNVVPDVIHSFNRIHLRSIVTQIVDLLPATPPQTLLRRFYACLLEDRPVTVPIHAAGSGDTEMSDLTGI